MLSRVWRKRKPVKEQEFRLCSFVPHQWQGELQVFLISFPSSNYFHNSLAFHIFQVLFRCGGRDSVRENYHTEKYAALKVCTANKPHQNVESSLVTKENLELWETSQINCDGIICQVLEDNLSVECFSLFLNLMKCLELSSRYYNCPEHAVNWETVL